jgi:hypothetical protein
VLPIWNWIDRVFILAFLLIGVLVLIFRDFVSENDVMIMIMIVIVIAPLLGWGSTQSNRLPRK